MAGTAKPKAVKVGDTVDLAKPGIVVLPDGSAVTARKSYVVRHKGKHKIDGKTVDVVEK